MRPLMRFAPYLAFFLSGGSSLIFQTIWTRMLHHVFGATSVAISTVLTAFMAGLGLGNYLAGRYANRIKHPIFAYAIAEAGVAAWGLLIPFLVASDGWLADVNAMLRQSLGAESSMFMIVRFLCVAPMILLPTTLMGASFPLLTRHFVTSRESAESASGKVGVLYALNTFGAATGPILSAFVLLPGVGLMWTNVIACAMNLSLFALILGLRKELIGSDWSSGVKLEVLPGKDEVEPETGITHEDHGGPSAGWLGVGLLGGIAAGVGLWFLQGTFTGSSDLLLLVAILIATATAGVLAATYAWQQVHGSATPAPAPRTKDTRPEATHEAEPAPARKKKSKKASKAASVEPVAEPRAEAPAAEAEPFIPRVARHMAFVCFAASGAAALAYEVVWSRALAMCIGSSIYSFALILDTFLIGIASGAAAMSAFMGTKKRPLWGVGVAAAAMVFMATAPMAVAHDTDGENRGGDVITWLVMAGFGAALVTAIGIYASRRAQLVQALEGSAEGEVQAPALTMLAVPLAYAVFTAFQFDGYLPKIIASVVTAVVVFIGLMVLLGRTPVLLLAVIQLYIGVATIVSYIWQDEIPYAFAQLVVSIENLPDHVGQVQFFMFITAMLCTLPATLGMGAMFPLTVRVWTGGGTGVARDVGRVYTGNTIGSIVGAWLPGFILMPWIGIEMTLQVGIWLNLLLALGMLIAGAAEPEDGPAPSPKRGAELWRTAAVVWVAALAIGADLDRSWQMLVPLALGIVPFFVRRHAAQAAWAAGLSGLAILVAALVEAESGTQVAWVQETFGLDDSPRLAMVLTMLPRALAVLAEVGVAWVIATSEPIEAFLIGAPEPEAKQAEKKPEPEDGAPRPGELPLWHAITVYVLSPAIPAMLALLYLATHNENASFTLRWNPTQMTLGVFRVSLAEGMLDPESWGQPELVYYEDGLSTTVTVERWGRHYALKNNGKVDASNGDDMPTQITVAAYPLLMHPAGPTDLDVAVVGFGSGVTVGTALSFPVDTVDVIELERAIPEAARWFADVNLLDYSLDHFPFVEMDRLEIINDDGRNYLAATDRMYDVIISEPSNPWITGVSDLFTVDHFEIASRRLREGGIYCQWVQLYEMSPENIKVIFRTFAEVFPHVIVLAADDRSSDTVVIGSFSPLSMDLARFGAAWELPPVEGRMSVADQLARAYLRTPYDIYARVLLASRDEVLSYTRIEERLREGTWIEDLASTNSGTCEEDDCRRIPVVVNTDDNAHIEFAAPRDLIGFERYESYLSTVYSPEWPYGRLDPVLGSFGEGEALSRNYAELAMSLIAHGRYTVAAQFIDLSQQAGETRETAVAVEVLTHLLSEEHEPPVRIEPPRPGPEMDRETATRLVEGFDAVRAAVDRSDYRRALEAMEDIPSPLRMHSGPGMRFLYGYLLYKAADGSLAQYRAASETLADLARTEEDYAAAHPELFYYLARAQDAEGEYDEAMLQMRRYIESRLTRTGDDVASTPEPPAAAAPTTDAPGESDKTENARD